MASGGEVRARLPPPPLRKQPKAELARQNSLSSDGSSNHSAATTAQQSSVGSIASLSGHEGAALPEPILRNRLPLSDETPWDVSASLGFFHEGGGGQDQECAEWQACSQEVRAGSSPETFSALDGRALRWRNI